jgi:hypothetical protein
MTEFEIKRLTKRVADLEKNQKKLLEITGGLLKQLQATQDALFELGEIVKKNTGKDHP